MIIVVDTMNERTNERTKEGEGRKEPRFIYDWVSSTAAVGRKEGRKIVRSKA